MIQTVPMWLVYEDSSGVSWFQPWEELAESGTLVDENTDEDMQLIGWTFTKPE